MKIKETRCICFLFEQIWFKYIGIADDSFVEHGKGWVHFSTIKITTWKVFSKAIVIFVMCDIPKL